jgi:hypothetical protein
LYIPEQRYPQETPQDSSSTPSKDTQEK